jgi:hypothetical protein
MESPGISPTALPPQAPQITLTGGSSVTVNSGQSAAVQFSLDRHDMGTAVSLSVSSLPQGVTAVFSPASLPASSAAQQFSLTLTAAATVVPVETTIQVTATGSGVFTAHASVTVLVQAVGQVRPLYQLLTVVYAPPGTNAGKGDSQVVYGSGSTTGTTETTSDSFKAGVDVTASVGVDLGPVNLGGSSEFTASQTGTDSSSVTISKSTSNQITVGGPGGDGIDHGHDMFYLWLNPLLNVTIGPGNNVAWEIAVDGPTMHTQYVYANQLENPSLMSPGVAKALASRGLTTADYLQILACDPFTSGTAIDPNRFLPTAFSFPYIPADTASDPVPTMEYTQTSSTTSTADQQVQVQYGCSISVSAGIQAALTASLKVTGSLEWTDTSSAGDSAGSSQSASVTIGGPSFGYTGPTDVMVYWDTVFSSFMFAFATEAPAASGTVTDSAGAPVTYKQLTLDVGGRKLSTFTDARGGFRFYGLVEGLGTISVDSQEFTVPVGPGGNPAALQVTA